MHKGCTTKLRHKNKIASLRKKCTSAPRKFKFRVPESKFGKRKLHNKGYLSSKKNFKTLNYMNTAIELDSGATVCAKSFPDLSAVRADNYKNVNEDTLQKPSLSIETEPFPDDSTLNAESVRTVGSDSLSVDSLEFKKNIEVQDVSQDNEKHIDSFSKLENESFTKLSAACLDKVNYEPLVEVLSNDSEPENTIVSKLAKNKNNLFKVSFSKERLKPPHIPKLLQKIRST